MVQVLRIQPRWIFAALSLPKQQPVSRGAVSRIPVPLPLRHCTTTTVNNGRRSAQGVSSPHSGCGVAADWNQLFLSLEVIYREELLAGR